MQLKKRQINESVSPESLKGMLAAQVVRKENAEANIGNKVPYVAIACIDYCNYGRLVDRPSDRPKGCVYNPELKTYPMGGICVHCRLKKEVTPTSIKYLINNKVGIYLLRNYRNWKAL